MLHAALQKLHYPKTVLYVFIAVTTFRVWLATVLPITGDEAYFIEWGRQPDLGFYDHPPMVGWWLCILLFISEKSWWLRLPQLIQPAILSWMLHFTYCRITSNAEKEKANILAVLVLLLPTNLINVLINTDTPLVYFSVASGLAWLIAIDDPQKRYWYWVCGIGLSGAVLSKFFAVLIGAAFFYDTIRNPEKNKAIGFAIVCLCCLPSLALLFYWNSTHCWTNYLFNFVNRHTAHNTHINIWTPSLYILTLLYAYSPPVLLSYATAWYPSMPYKKITRSIACIAFLPLIFFGFLSLIKKIGLHWILAFIPFGLLYTTMKVSLTTLKKITIFFIGFAIIQILAVFVISRMPLETWRFLGCYPSIVLEFEHKTILNHIIKNEALTTASYSKASVLSHYTHQYVPVFGMGSSHARHDDILTDWHQFQGKNIAILLTQKPILQNYSPFFSRMRIESLRIRGASFWLIHGQKFTYNTYQGTILREIKNRYYVLPGWLPTYHCYFCERYF